MDNLLGAVLTTGGLVAGIGVFLRRWRPAALYLLAYGVLLAVWPWQVCRYLEPVLYLVVPAVLIGCGWLANRFAAHWASRIVLALGFVLALNGAVRSARMIRVRASCVRSAGLPSPTCVDADKASFFAAVDYVGKYTPPDAVLLSAKAATLFYYTGRRGPSYRTALEQDSASLVPVLARSGAQYVLLSNQQWSEPRLADLLSADCNRLSLVAGFPPGTYLFGLRSAPRPPDDAACRALADYRRAKFDPEIHAAPWPP